MRSATTDSKTPYNYAHTSTPKAAWSHRYTAAKKKRQTDPAATTVAHTRYLSSSPAATLHGKTQGFVLRLPPQNIAHATSCSHSNAICNTDSKTPYNYAHTSTPKAAWSHRYTAAKKNDKPTAAATVAHTRYLSSSPAATLHGKTQGFVLRLPPQNIAHATSCSHSNANDLQPADSKTHYNYAHTSTPKAASSHRYTAAKKNDQPTPAAPVAHTRYLSSSAAATLHGKTQGFVLRLPPQLTTSLPHHTSHRHHFPSSPPSLRHRFPSSLPFRFLTTSHRHHSPSSPPLPFVTTSLRHHFPSSPLPFVTTSLRHHFPSSPLPFVTTSLLHHFPSSPLPFFTTSLPHHFPSSPLPFVITSLCQGQFHSFLFFCYVLVHYVLYIMYCYISTTLPQGQFHCFLFFCDVLLHYVLLCDLPPFIIVNCTKSKSHS